MATILVIGAIPSGLAGTVTTVRGLYIVRFFIGILGGTFVPCQAWTTTFFDKKVVGTANALVGGWGNSGGGVTFIVMVALYERLLDGGLSPHVAWRAAFAIVPVPILLITAVLVMVFGTDHPAGKWQDRHRVQAAHLPSSYGNTPSDVEKIAHSESEKKGTDVSVSVAPVSEDETQHVSAVDTAVNQTLTFRIAGEILGNPLTWLPAAAYMTTFGFELAIDAYLANIFYALYKSPTFGQTKAGYVSRLFASKYEGWY